MKIKAFIEFNLFILTYKSMNKTLNPTIGGAFDEIGESSLKARGLDIRYQQVLNHYLDTITDLINIIDQKVQLMEVVSSQLEKLTWIETTSNNDTLQKVSSILHISRGMLSGFKNDLKAMEEGKIDQDCPSTVSKFRNEIELLEENIVDTEMIFFELRTDSDFNDLDKQISNF
ncbi:hypothetical protein GCM10027284_39470 [Cyclobacterium sediminis]